MEQSLVVNEELCSRLPLPLAQLYRRAHMAKSDNELHRVAYCLWEASLKLLTSVVIFEYANTPRPDEEHAALLQKLIRPDVSAWCQILRKLLPVTAHDDALLHRTQVLFSSAIQDELPCNAELAVALPGSPADRQGAATLFDLFDVLAAYRTSVFGSSPFAERPSADYQRIGQALLAATGEWLLRVDVLAGQQLTYISDVTAQEEGRWLVQRYSLMGDLARRLRPLEVAGSSLNLPRSGNVYLDTAVQATNMSDSVSLSQMQSLHPLILFDVGLDQLFFLGTRRETDSAEYLCYTTGQTLDPAPLEHDLRALLEKLLGRPVNADSVTHWMQQIRAERPSEPAIPARKPSAHRAGEFELLTRMGQGGMGIVYRAWQSSLHRQVAVKTLQRSADSKAAARFAREIHALARVEHPNVVKIYSSGVEHDQLYFAMELIDGADMGAVNERLQAAKISADGVGYELWYEYLKQSIQEARLHEVPLDDQFQLPKMAEHESSGQPAATPRGSRIYVRHIVTLLRQVAQATQVMHDAGIVHRDIKPGNIMLTANGQNAVLMDLGLAQLAEENQQKLTQTRTFVGTLRYASPEQVLSASAVDRRSDIYSLGATLWELLTLRPLFGITDEVSSLELMQRIQHTDPQSIRLYNPSVPKDLDAIVSKCLEKSPAQRYQSAGELVDDLSRFLNSEPVRVRPLGKMARAGRYVRRHPVGSGFVLACVTTLVTMSILAVNAWNLQKERQFVAQLQEANERADESFRQAVKALDDVFTLVTEGDLRKRPDLQPLRDQLLTYYQGYVRQFSAGQELDPQIAVELAAALRRMAKITKDAGDKQDSLTHYSSAIRNYQSLLAKTPSNSPLIDALSQTLIDRGLLLQELREYEKAEQDLVQASDALTKLIDQNPQDLLLRRSLADAYHNLGILYEEENRYPQSFSFYERGRQIREQLVAQSDDRNFKRDLGRSYGYLGDVQIAMGEYQAAFRSYQRSVELRQHVAESEPSDHEARFQLARGYRNLGHLSQLESDLEEAIQWYLKATDEERRLVAEEPFIADYRADLGRYTNDLAEILISRGKLANKPEYISRAQTHLLEALAINRELTERNPGDMVAVSALACTYVNLARLALMEEPAQAQDYMDLSRQEFGRLSNYSADDLYQQAVLESLVDQAASLHAAKRDDTPSPTDERHIDKALSLLSQAVIKSRYTVLPRLGRDPAFVDLRNRTEFQLLSAIGFQGFENHDQVAVRGDRSLASAASRSAYKHLYVLAVGVSSYKDSQYSLQFPDDDARDLAAVLDQQRHFETVTVKALTDEQANRVSILNALKQLRLKALHPSLLLVTLSGHGRLHESGDYYFLPFDFDFDPSASIAATGISWDDLLREFREVPGAVIVVLDTCHSGATAQVGFRGLSSDAMDTSVRQAAEKISGAEGRGVAVLASSLSSQAAQERPGWGHGALSLAILEALCNQHVYQQTQRSRLPALGTQRMLSMEQVRAYAVERVNELTDGQQKVIVQSNMSLIDIPFNVCELPPADADADADADDR